jgi:thymidylate kinase
MKLLIIEGTDRCGKDTLIESVSKEYKYVIKRHWSYPKGETNDEKTAYQKDSFNWEFKLHNILQTASNEVDKNSIIIWNRSHIGELVYGKIYRDSQPETWVMDLETKYCFDQVDNIYLVYLYADAEFVVKQDDGKSYSANLEDKQHELFAFNDACVNSSIRKKLFLKVNEGSEYKSEQDILNTVFNFIND